jgi:hypothetical protein
LIIGEVVPPQAVVVSGEVIDVYMVVPGGGYWPMVRSGPRKRVRGTILRLPSGPLGWWHRLHNVGSRRRGEGLRIGVIDECLPRQPAGSPLAHVNNVGFSFLSDLTPAKQQRAFHTNAKDQTIVQEHGESVCSVLAARPAADTDAFEGIVPAADILFCAAGEDDSDLISPTRLANAIDYLVEEGCDILTFSCGDSTLPLEALRHSMEGALDRGVLCFTAAGNEGRAPKSPARLDECFAVAAVGQKNTVPQETWYSLEESQAVQTRDDLYLWKDSAFGPQVEFAGASCLTVPQAWCRYGLPKAP